MTVLRLLMAKGISLPVAGDTVAVPVEGGREWTELGTFVGATYDRLTEQAVLLLELSDSIERVELEEP